MDVKVSEKSYQSTKERPSEAEAEAAVRTLLAWAGDDPRREGLRETPQRVIKAFREYFAGYGQDPADVLDRVFEDVGGYDDMVMLKDIPSPPTVNITSRRSLAEPMWLICLQAA